MVQLMNTTNYLLSIGLISIFLGAPYYAAYAKDHIVLAKAGKASEMRFEPAQLEISVGDTVTWINDSNVYHNVKSLQKDIPATAVSLKSPGLRKKGDKWSYTFAVTGKYDYFCVPHRAMGMVGTIIVK